MKNKNYKYALVALAAITTLATAVPALADNNNSGNTGDNNQPPVSQGIGGRGMGDRGGKGMGMMGGGIFGTVTAKSGNTITVDGKQGFGQTATTVTYSVDATNAKIVKDTNTTTATISDIAVGDTVMVRGTVTGTNVVATMIRDGKFPVRNALGTGPKKGDGKGVLGIMGDGNPVVAGTVTSINGSSLVITNPSNNTYTVDAGGAKISKGGVTTATISDIAVGDLVVVQGTFSGSNVTATMVVDHPAKSNSTNNSGNPAPHTGLLGGVGSFFSHLFGF